MKQPLVSVVITCYNYGHYVQAAIESILSQTYKNTELIIINDGSTDDSYDIISKYKDVARILSRKNKGIIVTRNEGLDLSKGDYLVFLDADDTLSSDYIENVVASAERYSADIVYTDANTIGESSGKIIFPEITVELMKIRNRIHMSSLIRKSAIEGQRFDEKLNKLSHEDWDFFLGLVLKGVKIVKDEKALLNYRIHKPGTSRNKSRSDTEQQFMQTINYIYGKYMRQYEDFIVNQEEFFESLLSRNSLLEEELGSVREHNKKINDELLGILNSKTWRVTSAIAAPLSIIKNIFRH